MDALIGKTLSHYRIVEKIGAGGMGEVYRAHDSRLGRDVAIKALPEGFDTDPERVSRFEREAKVLASLNHPNVAGIYGVEDVGGHRYLALEFVQGETLAARLLHGPLPLEETIEICLQIATGMEAAHEAGIVHRDLKPGNVMITPEDQVKVVDFGLAKGRESEPASGQAESPTITESPTLQHSPTLGTPATLPGVILGTAAYLSPEQARGKAVDRRTDIWSFGCVLYECLTGRRAFEGDTVSDLVAAILKGDADWSRLPKNLPPRLLELLQHCFEKDPRKRLRDMGDARLALEEIREGNRSNIEPRSASKTISPRVAGIAAIVAMIGTVMGIVLWRGSGPGQSSGESAPGAKHATIEIPRQIQAWDDGGAISPDGRYLVVWGRPHTTAGAPLAPARLYKRRMNSREFEEIKGSEGLNVMTWWLPSVWFSPDGRWLYFKKAISDGSADLCLVKVLLEGSAPPINVTSWDPSWSEASWTPLGSGDVLIVSGAGHEFVRVPANGGRPTNPIAIRMPEFSGGLDLNGTLPGDRGVLLNLASTVGGGYRLDTGVLDPKSGEAKILVQNGSNAVYSPTGHLLFTRGSALLAIRFDLKSLEAQGEPIPITDGLRVGVGYNARFALSRDGTLVYRSGDLIGARRILIAVDRDGRVSEWSYERGVLAFWPRVSPDGKQAACMAIGAKNLDEIRIYGEGRASARRVRPTEAANWKFPVWSPDGSRLAVSRFNPDPDDGIYVQSLDGKPPTKLCARSTASTFGFYPTSWSPDGRELLITSLGEGGRDVLKVSAILRQRDLETPVPILSGPADQAGACFSPDGQWIAYHSNESGRYEVYVASYHTDGSLGPPRVVGEGEQPRWSWTGRELFILQRRYRSLPHRVLSVALQHGRELTASAPIVRWNLDSLRVADDSSFDILPDGRLLAIQRGDDEDFSEAVTSLACVFNFPDEIREKVMAAEKR